MARTARDIQTDLDRIELMLSTARTAGNVDTVNTLEQAHARIESALEELTKDSDAKRRSDIDAANDALISYENEANVSRELKAEIQDSRGDLVNLRRSHE